jgi:16S rRNA (uracil1498-N3)-methyltransferase
MTKHDVLDICNLDTSKDYKCEIKEIQNEMIICEILEEMQINSESNVKVTVFQGLPKVDKMELIIQKAVELGVTDITPLEMKRCVVKLIEKDKLKKIERWQKISEVAAKQSGRNIIPQINKVTNIKELKQIFEKYDVILVAYENEKENTIKKELKKLKNGEELKIAIVIGPEGGIEPQEIELLKGYGAKTISLGKRILRTETASLNILSVIMYELEL